ncbi:MAG: hypothetical protein AB1736_14220 [Chloroflexota bacterium]
MNDRFSANVRQHLLNTANERPAGGQLEAVLDRLADTPQRPPLVARLTWFPGRVGPFPARAVRYALFAAALLAAATSVAIIGGGGGPLRSTVFEGTWTTTDPEDQSTMTLVVAAGTTPTVHFEDAFATGAACVADPVKVFTAEGTGRISGSILAVSFPDGGGCGLMIVEVGPWFYEYDEATDTLEASDGLAWSRVELGGDPSGPPLAELPAASAPTSQASATPDPACTYFPVGGAYRAPAGSLALTVELPDASDDASWSGLSDAFRVEKAPCLVGGPVRIEAAPITRVYIDLCNPAVGASVVDSSAAAMAILQPLGGLDEVGPTEVTLGSYAGLRLDFYSRPDFGTPGCPNERGRAFDGLSSFETERNATVHLLDVDGTVLALVTYWNEEPNPETVAEVDAVLAFLRIEP